jgi:ankyrin repeat protein
MIGLEKDAVLVKISSMNKSAYHVFKNKCDFLELKWDSNPFRKNEYIEFLRPRYVFTEDWSGQELDAQVIVNQKLYDACKKFNGKKAKEAILEGANVHLRVNCNEDDDSYWNSRSPLYFAIEQNNIEFTRALIEAGLDVTGIYEDASPLAFAMNLDVIDSDMIALLIQAGCNVNVCAWRGYSLLNRAFDVDDLVIAKMLIDAGANIYVDDYSLLDDALTKDDLSFLKLLLEAGYDVNRLDNEGCPGLHRAIFYICDDAAFELLLSAGADVYQLDAQGRTLLDLIGCMLQEYQSKPLDHYRLRAEVAQLYKIKEMLS